MLQWFTTLSVSVYCAAQTAQMREGEIHYGPEKDHFSAVCSSLELLAGQRQAQRWGAMVKRAGMRDADLFFYAVAKHGIIASGLWTRQCTKLPAILGN